MYVSSWIISAKKMYVDIVLRQWIFQPIRRAPHPLCIGPPMGPICWSGSESRPTDYGSKPMANKPLRRQLCRIKCIKSQSTMENFLFHRSTRNYSICTSIHKKHILLTASVLLLVFQRQTHYVHTNVTNRLSKPWYKWLRNHAHVFGSNLKVSNKISSCIRATDNKLFYYTT